MAERNEPERNTAQVLVQSTGLNLATAEMDRVIMLYERFARDRATLASATPGEAEPATIFTSSRWDDRP